jgi:hypothetical protein
MGHSSIQVTLERYGHLIPGGNKYPVDRLYAPITRLALGEICNPGATSQGGGGLRERKNGVDQAVIGRRDGVSDGFRNEGDPQGIQADQVLTDADCGKFEQKIRKSATSRNQNFPSQDPLNNPSASDEEQTS